MPELIESHSISNELQKIIACKLIIDIVHENFPSLQDTIGKTIHSVFSIGKKVIFKLNDGYIVTSLGMTGKYLLHHANHTRVTITYGKSINFNGKYALLIQGEIYYIDSRKFGSVIYYSEEEYQKLLSGLGPDILGGFSEEYWLEISMKKKINKPIIDFIKDQSKIAGLGNYMSIEVMYNAKISPLRKVSSLSKDEILRLRESIFFVVEEVKKYSGLSLGDSVVNNYMTPNGKRGSYPCKIYRKNKSPKGNKVIKYKKNKSAQTIYFVEEEQK